VGCFGWGVVLLFQINSPIGVTLFSSFRQTRCLISPCSQNAGTLFFLFFCWPHKKGVSSLSRIFSPPCDLLRPPFSSPPDPSLFYYKKTGLDGWLKLLPLLRFPQRRCEKILSFFRPVFFWQKKKQTSWPPLGSQPFFGSPCSSRSSMALTQPLQRFPYGNTQPPLGTSPPTFFSPLDLFVPSSPNLNSPSFEVPLNLVLPPPPPLLCQIASLPFFSTW